MEETSSNSELLSVDVLLCHDLLDHRDHCDCVGVNGVTFPLVGECLGVDEIWC